MPDSRKSSFILYADFGSYIDRLTDEEAGILIKAVFLYVNTGALPDSLSERADIVFAIIQNTIDRNNEKWRAICQQRSEAGQRGGIASGKSRAKQKEANEANASRTKQKEANEADNVNDNDTENVPENEPVYESVPASVDEKVKGNASNSQNAAFPHSYQQTDEADMNRKRNEAIRKLQEAMNDDRV